MFRRIKSILSSSEDRLFARLKKHVELSLKGLTMLEEYLRYCRTDPPSLDGLVKELAALEKECDNIVRSADLEVTSGAIMPSIVADLEALLDRLDNIMDEVYHIAKQLRRMSGLLSDPYVDKLLRGRYLSMVSLARTAVEALNEIFSKALRDVKALPQLAVKVESLEEEVDELKDLIYDELYKEVRDCRVFVGVHYLVTFIDSVLDNAEDVALLVTTVVKSLSL